MTVPVHHVAVLVLPGVFALELGIAAQVFGSEPQYRLTVCSPAPTRPGSPGPESARWRDGTRLAALTRHGSDPAASLLPTMRPRASPNLIRVP
jgi:hypothetical protein